jgi:hypothetical protein
MESQCDIATPRDRGVVAFIVAILVAEALLFVLPARQARAVVLLLGAIYIPGVVAILVNWLRNPGRLPALLHGTGKHFWKNPTPGLPSVPVWIGRVWALTFLVPAWLHLPYFAFAGVVRSVFPVHASNR